MAKATSFWSITMADNTVNSKGSPETTNAEIAVTPLSAANVVAVTTAIAAFKVAVKAILIGNQVGEQTTFVRPTMEQVPADTNLAQRENKYLFRYHGATTFGKETVSYGTADLSLLPDGSEFLDLTADPGLALKTAFEAVVKMKYDASEAAILDSVQFVGRNS